MAEYLLYVATLSLHAQHVTPIYTQKTKSNYQLLIDSGESAMPLRTLKLTCRRILRIRNSYISKLQTI
jgi:hypothetical protein